MLSINNRLVFPFNGEAVASEHIGTHAATWGEFVMGLFTEYIHQEDGPTVIIVEH